ncbi:MAG: peptidase, partial [Gammaproteobacteria bacterium]
MKIDFPHRQSAHCESGVTANLLSYQGRNISEALAFGIGGGLFFGYFPFVRVNHLPLITFRCAPGAIFKKCARRLGAKVHSQTFSSPQEATTALDRALATGRPQGLQTGVYWLPYFPAALRFHFNAHNLVVFGRDGEDYLISDPVFEEPVRCSRSDLERARFAKGALAPKGRMYSVERIDAEVDMAKAIRQAIR